MCSWAGPGPRQTFVTAILAARTSSDVSPGFRLDTSVWEDRLTLARLREKVQPEDGRLVLRIEQEDWKVRRSSGEDGCSPV